MANQVRTLAQILSVSAITLGGCGGGTPVETRSTPATLDVRVSAGSPVADSTVTVYAISDATGLVNNGVGAAGVLGAGGPTDSLGRATIPLAAYSGPIQVEARGPTAWYPNPTLPPNATGPAAVIQIPSTFALTSFVAKFGSSGTVTVPVTLLTTLADHEALAYSRGLHPSHPAKSTLSEALAARDPLFVDHITTIASGWNPAALRKTVPAALGEDPQTLVDGAYAALFDLALNQLARDIAAQAGFGSDSNAINAITLVQLLEQDVDADGRFDGLGAAARPLFTQGTSPVGLDSQFLRRPLAQALDEWIQNQTLNKSGISQADLISNQVYASLTQDSSDLFGALPVGPPFDPADHTPPALAFAVAPSLYTGASTVTLEITATDPSGVKAVHAQLGSRVLSAVAQGGDTWVLIVDKLSEGHNVIAIWGEDLANPTSNSGFGGGAPYQLVADILLDVTPPSATYDASFRSYFSEQAMAVQTNPDGSAKTPPVYQYGLAAKSPVDGGTPIYKAATTLSAVAGLNAAELESTNAANLPVLRFVVPFNPATDSPISVATFEVSVACAGCGFPPAAGNLLLSPSVASGLLLYDLPISTDTVLALGSVPGPATLGVTLNLVDAAGNSATTTPAVFSFHLVGAPVAVAEDVAYASANDPRGTYYYKLSGPFYMRMFGVDPVFGAEGAVRLVRYLVTNPAPQPVGVAASIVQRVDSAAPPESSWAVLESWSDQDHPTATGFVSDGYTFAPTAAFTQSYASGTCPGAPCYTGTGLPANVTCGHTANSSAHWAQVAVPPTLQAAGPARDAHAPVAALAYQNAPAGSDTSSLVLSGGYYTVPGASGSVPGTVVIYLARPAAPPSGKGIQWPWTALVPGDPAGYEYSLFDFYSPTGATSSLVCKNSAGVTTYLANRPAHRVFRQLSGSVDDLAGSLTVSSRSLEAAQLVGESREVQALDFTRTISH